MKIGTKKEKKERREGRKKGKKEGGRKGRRKRGRKGERKEWKTEKGRKERRDGKKQPKWSVWKKSHKEIKSDNSLLFIGGSGSYRSLYFILRTLDFIYKIRTHWWSLRQKEVYSDL